MVLGDHEINVVVLSFRFWPLLLVILGAVAVLVSGGASSLHFCNLRITQGVIHRIIVSLILAVGHLRKVVWLHLELRIMIKVLASLVLSHRVTPIRSAIRSRNLISRLL